MSYLEDFTLVRVRNDTGIALSDVTVRFPQEIVNYGELPAGESSKYGSVVLALAVATVTARSSDGRQLEVPLACDLGETDTGRGRFVGVLELVGGEVASSIRREEP